MQGNEQADGHRSLEALAKLRADRLALGLRAGRTVSELHWRPAQSYAIQRDDRREVWHAGHVSALLSDGFVVIAGTQTGGVWLLTPVNLPNYRQGHRAVPLSDAWDTPDITCLAYGPDGTQQVYVGCGSTALILLELKPVLGGMLLDQTTAIPLNATGDVLAIAVLTQLRRVVLATSTGVWWSAIPAAANDAAAYAWQMGRNLPFGSYSGLAAGPDESVAAAAWGDGTFHGLFRGVWDNNILAFTPSTVANASTTAMRRTSLASCDSRPERMYAVAAGEDTFINAVIASRDGGATWDAIAIPPDHGNLGFYNNCIAVSPYRPDVVALGWRSGGPFLSRDAGASWQQPAHDTNNAHLHSDLHALYFARNSLDADLLYVGSDGGIVVSDDFGQSFASQFSRSLNNLQFYGGGRGTTAGALTVSSRFFGLVAGGTQDNGNIYLLPDSDAGSAWHTLEGGDGGLNRFVDPLKALLRFNNTFTLNNVEIGNRVRIAFWDQATGSFGPGYGTVVPADGNADGVAPNAIEVVLTPDWRKNGQLMYAMVGAGATVYGLFANGDGSDAKLLRLGTAADTVSALASFDGTSVLVGTTTGRIFLLDSATGNVTEQTLPAGVRGDVSRVEVYVQAGWALLVSPKVKAYALVGGRLLHFDGTTWATRSSWWVTFEIDRASERLFAANDSDVFVSSDGGVSWRDASGGLPVRPHCTDLRIGATQEGGRELYLATYGRSVWRAAITLPPPSDQGFKVPQEVTDALFGVLQDGGGIIRVGGRLHYVPPRSPLRDLLIITVLDELARSMSAERSVPVRRALMEQLRQLADEQLQQLG